VTHRLGLAPHVDVSLLREISTRTERNLYPSLLGAGLGQTPEERGDVSLALGLVGGATRGDHLEGLLSIFGVHVTKNLTLPGAHGRTALGGADGQGHVVGHVDGQLLGTLGHLLEVGLDPVHLLVTLLDEEGTTVGLENHASLGVHELGGSRHLLFTEIIFLMALQPYHPFLFDLLVFLSIFSRVL